MVTSAARLHAFQEVFKKLCKPGDGQPGDYVLKGELVGMQALTCDRGDSCDACKNIELPAKIDLIMPSGSSQPVAEDPILKVCGGSLLQTDPQERAKTSTASSDCRPRPTAPDPVLKLRDPNQKQDLYSIDLIKLVEWSMESWESIQESEADTEPNITLTIKIQGLNDCSMILRFKQDIELVPGSDSVCPNAELCRKLHITLDGSVALSGFPGETDTSFKDKDDLLKWASVTYASKMEDIIKYAPKSRRCSACDMK